MVTPTSMDLGTWLRQQLEQAMDGPWERHERISGLERVMEMTCRTRDARSPPTEPRRFPCSAGISEVVREGDLTRPFWS